MSTKDKTKILLILPLDLKRKISNDAKADNRNVNNYILTVLLKRDQQEA